MSILSISSLSVGYCDAHKHTHSTLNVSSSSFICCSFHTPLSVPHPKTKTKKKRLIQVTASKLTLLGFGLVFDEGTPTIAMGFQGFVLCHYCDIYYWVSCVVISLYMLSFLFKLYCVDSC